MWNNFFSYEGRLNRRPYFFRGLVLTIVIKLLSDVPAAFKISFSTPVRVLAIAVILAAAVLGLFQSIKRLHDVELSGWYSVVLLIPFANFILGLYLTFKKGTEGDNPYGPDPLAQPAE